MADTSMEPKVPEGGVKQVEVDVSEGQGKQDAPKVPESEVKEEDGEVTNGQGTQDEPQVTEGQGKQDAPQVTKGQGTQDAPKVPESEVKEEDGEVGNGQGKEDEPQVTEGQGTQDEPQVTGGQGTQDEPQVTEGKSAGLTLVKHDQPKLANPKVTAGAPRSSPEAASFSKLPSVGPLEESKGGASAEGLARRVCTRLFNRNLAAYLLCLLRVKSVTSFCEFISKMCPDKDVAKRCFRTKLRFSGFVGDFMQLCIHNQLLAPLVGAIKYSEYPKLLSSDKLKGASPWFRRAVNIVFKKLGKVSDVSDDECDRRIQEALHDLLKHIMVGVKAAKENAEKTPSVDGAGEHQVVKAQQNQYFPLLHESLLCSLHKISQMISVGNEPGLDYKFFEDGASFFERVSDYRDECMQGGCDIDGSLPRSAKKLLKRAPKLYEMINRAIKDVDTKLRQLHEVNASACLNARDEESLSKLRNEETEPPTVDVHGRYKELVEGNINLLEKRRSMVERRVSYSALAESLIQFYEWAFQVRIFANLYQDYTSDAQANIPRLEAEIARDYHEKTMPFNDVADMKPFREEKERPVSLRMYADELVILRTIFLGFWKELKDFEEPEKLCKSLNCDAVDALLERVGKVVMKLAEDMEEEQQKNGVEQADQEMVRQIAGYAHIARVRPDLVQDHLSSCKSELKDKFHQAVLICADGYRVRVHELLPRNEGKVPIDTKKLRVFNPRGKKVRTTASLDSNGQVWYYKSLPYSHKSTLPNVVARASRVVHPNVAPITKVTISLRSERKSGYLGTIEPHQTLQAFCDNHVADDFIVHAFGAKPVVSGLRGLTIIFRDAVSGGNSGLAHMHGRQISGKFDPRDLWVDESGSVELHLNLSELAEEDSVLTAKHKRSQANELTSVILERGLSTHEQYRSMPAATVAQELGKFDECLSETVISVVDDKLTPAACVRELEANPKPRTRRCHTCSRTVFYFTGVTCGRHHFSCATCCTNNKACKATGRHDDKECGKIFPAKRVALIRKILEADEKDDGEKKGQGSVSKVVLELLDNPYAADEVLKMLGKKEVKAASFAIQLLPGESEPSRLEHEREEEAFRALKREELALLLLIYVYLRIVPNDERDTALVTSAVEVAVARWIKPRCGNPRCGRQRSGRQPITMKAEVYCRKCTYGQCEWCGLACSKSRGVLNDHVRTCYRNRTRLPNYTYGSHYGPKQLLQRAQRNAVEKKLRWLSHSAKLVDSAAMLRDGYKFVDDELMVKGVGIEDSQWVGDSGGEMGGKTAKSWWGRK